MEYKYHHTAYLPGSNSYADKQRRSQIDAIKLPEYTKLDDYSRRLDKQYKKLNDLSEQCATSLSKIKTYCSQASKFILSLATVKTV